MRFAPGSRVGPYEIITPLGSGGMGEIWKARDPRLNREVAIKTSYAKFSERFEREARAIAALNHPHICQIYDVGPDYIVMELVDGVPVKGPLPLYVALKLAIQLASAIEAAHRKAIAHRDLKPANILNTKSGIKVLDFGLAKIEQSKAATANDETLTRALTQEGAIVGTLQYMAPEQLNGGTVDYRADLFSFGCVLYEILSGKRAFDGPTTASVVAGILEREPPSVGDLAPAPLDRLLKRCLMKDPDERYQSAHDIKVDLEWIAAGRSLHQSVKESPLSRTGKLAWAGMAICALGLAAVSSIHFREKAPEAPVERFTISPPENTSFPMGERGAGNSSPALSPDGRMIVFRTLSPNGKAQLWIRPIDSVTAQVVAGTEGGLGPFWSPDSKSLGFFADGKLKRIEVAGGPALSLAEAMTTRSFGGSWSSQGTILFNPNGGPLMKIPASGGAPTQATKPKATEIHGSPWFLPDGRNFLFASVQPGTFGAVTICVGSLDSGNTTVLAQATAGKAIYAAGHLLFVRDGTLMAQPFETASLSTTGNAVPVAERIQGSNFGASATGTLIYVMGGAPRQQLAWFDRGGKRLASVGEPQAADDPRSGRLNFSPDRRSAAVIMAGKLWLFDVPRGLRNRFTFDTLQTFEAIWTPDGGEIVYNYDSGLKVYRKASNGNGREELILADALIKDPTSFSPDGKLLAYDTAGDPKTGSDIWLLPNPLGPVGASKPRPFLNTSANEHNPQISPDGKWIAWESDESGREEIYAAAIPGPGGKRLISPGGGSWPRWRRDGREIFYLASSGFLTTTAVEVKAGVLETGETHPLFRAAVSGYRYDISTDGQRILANVAPEQTDAPLPMTVVVNWPASLKK